MADAYIARLGFAVETGQLIRAQKDLNNLATATQRTEAQVKKTSPTLTKLHDRYALAIDRANARVQAFATGIGGMATMFGTATLAVGFLTRATTAFFESMRKSAELKNATEKLNAAWAGFGNTLNSLTGASGAMASALGFITTAVTVASNGMKMLSDLVGRLTAEFPILGAAAKAVGVVIATIAGAVALGALAQLTAGFVSLAATLAGPVIGALGSVIKLVGALALLNPATAIIAGLVAAGTAAYLFRDQIKNVLGVDVVGSAKTAGNSLIGSFKFAYESILIVWNKLPGAVGDLAIQAANNTITAIKQMVNGAIDLLNGLVTKANEMTSKVGIPAMPTLDPLGTDPTFSNPYAGAAGDMGSAISGAASGAFNTDYIGAAGTAPGAFTDKLTATITGTEAVVAKTGPAAAGIGKIGAASKDAVEKIDEVAKSMQNLAEQSIGSLSSEIATLAVDGKANFGSLAKSIIKSLLEIAIQAAIVKPMLAWMGFANGGTFGAAAGSVTANATGNVFNRGLNKFAAGGTFTNSIVNSPTPFKFASGGGFDLGVMGEAGPEAVMPLSRGPDGSLGVQMHGAGAARSSEPASITITVEANDYFDARVKQVSGKVATAVTREGMNQVAASVPSVARQATANTRRNT